jgi:hypothetical protein
LRRKQNLLLSPSTASRSHLHAEAIRCAGQPSSRWVWVGRYLVRKAEAELLLPAHLCLMAATKQQVCSYATSQNLSTRRHCTGDLASQTLAEMEASNVQRKLQRKPKRTPERNSERKPERTTIAAWFAKHWRIRRKRVPVVEQSARVERRGHDYQHMYTSDYARVQFGDHYIAQQNILPSPVIETGEKKMQDQRDRFMADLSFDSMESRLAMISPAQSKTCSWLFTAPEYQKWRDSKYRTRNNGFLWIKGKPGAGKSTMMKHALDYGQSILTPDGSVLSFFFNARGYGLEKSTEGMYRSMLHQLYRRYPERLPKSLPLDSTALKQQGWPVERLQNMLRDALLDFRCTSDLSWYIDALDECDEDDIRDAVQYFDKLAVSATSHKIKLFICFASRHYPQITISKHESINLDLKEEHQNDIAIFVTDHLCKADVVTQDLRREIQRRSAGVFLWVVLVVEIMNKMIDRGATRSKLLPALKKVPDRVGDLLKAIMSEGDIALLPTLQWVLFSIEPLLVNELYTAVMTSVGRLSTAIQDAAETSQEQMRTFILTSSRGLVEFSRSGFATRAQFVHETVREYLLNGGLSTLDPNLTGNVEAISHAKIGQWCQQVVKTSNFHESWSTFDIYSKRHMLFYLQSAYSGKVIDLPFIDAISHRTWLKLRQHASINSGICPGDEVDDSKATTSLYILILSRCTELVEAILQRQLACPPQASEKSPTPSSRSLKASRIPTVDVNAICSNSRYGTALLAAIYMHRKGATSDRVIELLFSCGANPNLAAKSGYPPSHIAFLLLGTPEKNASDRLNRLLLQHGAVDHHKTTAKSVEPGNLNSFVAFGVLVWLIVLFLS